MKKIDNTQGKIFYGMHFYPGVAQYDEPDKDSYTIFINEDTIRKMDPTFAGCPVFVEHVDEVEGDLDKLRSESDGWVIESFYNSADGKHWVKFIATSDKAISAIRRGFRLSNSYFPTKLGTEGMWNGVSYSKEITDGAYDHLAIVDNPRYEESVIMTPDEFKSYNEEKTNELIKLANSKEQKEKKTMGSKFNFFKRTKVENSSDLESTMIELPKSKKEMTLEKVINEFDAIMNMNGYANEDHMVKVNDGEMSVKELVKKHQKMCQEAEEMKKKNAETEDGGEPGKGADDDKKKKNDGDEEEDPAMDNADLDIDQMGDVGDRGGDKHLKNEDEEDDKKKKKENDDEDEKEKKKNEARKKAAALRNANLKQIDEEVARVDLPEDQVARGRARYGSSN